MNIEPISNGNLRIWLAEDEMKEWGLDGDNSGIRRLVRRAFSVTGRRQPSRTWAEMIPVEGGCVLLVSHAVHNCRQPTVYAVEAEELSQIYARWRSAAEETAQVYAVEDGYRVVLYGEQSDALLREYGTPLGCGEGMAAHIAEYGEWVGNVTAPAPAPPESGDRGH